MRVLPAGSLAQALAAAAGQLAAVWGGQSLAAVPPAPATVRAQVQEVTYGCLRRFGWADALIAALCPRPPEDLPVRALLAVALYRLATRPAAAHVIVDQAVEAVAAVTRRDLRGLTNGVLRNYLRRAAALEADIAVLPGVRYGLPDWWLARLQAAWPNAWTEVAACSLAHPPMTLRVNQRRTTPSAYAAQLAAAGIAVDQQRDATLWLATPVPVERLPGFFDGLCSVQDAGAQHAAPLLAAQPGQRVLDACAAPGGKTTHLIELGATDVLALDSDATRAVRIEDNLARLGGVARVQVGDAGDPGAWWDGRPFARILVDAPCTASGVVRRHPDAKWLRRDADVAGFAAQQARLLEALWPLLEAGGRLLYATCSVFPEENARQIAAFCARHNDARRVDTPAIPGGQLLPGAAHDGFFYALLDKRA